MSVPFLNFYRSAFAISVPDGWVGFSLCFLRGLLSIQKSFWLHIWWTLSALHCLLGAAAPRLARLSRAGRPPRALCGRAQSIQSLLELPAGTAPLPRCLVSGPHLPWQWQWQWQRTRVGPLRSLTSLGGCCSPQAQRGGWDPGLPAALLAPRWYCEQVVQTQAGRKAMGTTRRAILCLAPSCSLRLESKDNSDMTS